MPERTFVLIKPDALARGLVGRIIERIEGKGFIIVGLKVLKLTKGQAEELYKMHLQKTFFKELIQYITSSSVIVMVVEGFKVIETMRKICGTTNPLEAEAGSIRGSYGLTVTKNVIHTADSLENANREISIFFRSEEITSNKM